MVLRRRQAEADGSERHCPSQARSVSGECGDIAFKGYPFRIGLFCSKVTVDDKENGVSASFGELRSAAQVYNPGHIVWELDSPAEIRSAHGLTISAAWQNMQSSIVTKLNGIDRSSLVIDGLKAQAVSSVTGQTIDFDAVKRKCICARTAPISAGPSRSPTPRPSSGLAAGSSPPRRHR